MALKADCPYFRPLATNPEVCAKWARPVGGPDPLGLRRATRADQESDSEEGYMVHWAWLIAALFIGSVFGLFLIGRLLAGRDEMAYMQGLAEGRADGFRDGLKELGQTG